mmetsp:Transcript_19042/g.26876  ORF Transcript_19042/g.26876 Transcript_19042/m.26876 type:complete len:114 (+) Transcript_19042:749-1090(+)
MASRAFLVKDILCVPGATARPPPSAAVTGDSVIHTLIPASLLPIFRSSQGQKTFVIDMPTTSLITSAISEHCILEQTKGPVMTVLIRVVLRGMIVIIIVIIETHESCTYGRCC